jgi:hypothetical protein
MRTTEKKQDAQYGYILLSYELDVDGYHWKTVCAKADMFEKDYW